MVGSFELCERDLYFLGFSYDPDFSLALSKYTRSPSATARSRRPYPLCTGLK